MTVDEGASALPVLFSDLSPLPGTQQVLSAGLLSEYITRLVRVCKASQPAGTAQLSHTDCGQLPTGAAGVPCLEESLPLLPPVLAITLEAPPGAGAGLLPHSSSTDSLSPFRFSLLTR